MYTLSIAGQYKEDGVLLSTGSVIVKNITTGDLYESVISDGYYEITIQEPRKYDLFRLKYPKCDVLFLYTTNTANVIKDINYQTGQFHAWTSIVNKEDIFKYKVIPSDTCDKMLVKVVYSNPGDGFFEPVLFIGEFIDSVSIKFNYSGTYLIQTYGLTESGVVIGEKSHNISITNAEKPILKYINRIKYTYYDPLVTHNKPVTMEIKENTEHLSVIEVTSSYNMENNAQEFNRKESTLQFNCKEMVYTFNEVE